MNDLEGNFTCRGCGKVGECKDMRRWTVSVRSRSGQCKKCHSEYVYNKRMEERIEGGLYTSSCENCGWFSTDKKKTICRKCGGKLEVETNA